MAFNPFGGLLGGSQRQYGSSGLDLLRNPETALPIAAALLSGPNNQQSFSNAFAAAGNARSGAMKRNATIEWLQGNRPELAAQVQAGMPIAEAWKQVGRQQKHPSSVQEYEYAKGQGYGGSYTDFVRDMKRAGSSSVTVNNLPKLTVDQAKNSGFLIRGRDANSVLSELEGQGTSFANKMLEQAPLGLGNFGLDANYQRYEQARRDFVNAVLRRESGAVISNEEFANAERQYFPQPGDGPEVIAQKRQNRINAVRGFEVGAGPGVQHPAVTAPPKSSTVQQSGGASNDPLGIR
ncbi:MAG: hypothetical protein GY807_20515 [Gammaproteobacteria bacterium]|nr:hypothetical protein [Gammaproteobacteria bacterium]